MWPFHDTTEKIYVGKFGGVTPFPFKEGRMKPSSLPLIHIGTLISRNFAQSQFLSITIYTFV